MVYVGVCVRVHGDAQSGNTTYPMYPLSPETKGEEGYLPVGSLAQENVLVLAAKLLKRL